VAGGFDRQLKRKVRNDVSPAAVCEVLHRMNLFALLALVATPAQPIDSKIAFFVGEWAEVLGNPATLTVTPEGHFVVRRWQPASMNRMDRPSAMCRIEGQLEVVKERVVWRAAKQMATDFEALRDARRRHAGPDIVQAAQTAFFDWCYPIADFAENVRSRNLSPLEFAPWDGRPQLFFVAEDQFAGLFGPWPHAQVFRRVGAEARQKVNSTRWMLWVELHEMLGLSGALTVERDGAFTLKWNDDCVERGSFSARAPKTGRITMKSQSSCAGPVVRELDVRIGELKFHPTIRNGPAIIRSGTATLHFVPVP